MRDWATHLLMVGLSLMLLDPSSARAQRDPDPVAPLVGSWDLPGTLTKLKIHADRTIDHSKLGAGTIQHEETSYFRLVFRQHHLTCRYEVRKYSENDLTFTIAVMPSDSDCELGNLRRAPGTTPPLPEQKGKASEAPPPKAPQPAAGTAFKDCDECPELVVVPVGQFVMGSPDQEKGRLNIEGPQRSVKIPANFAVGRYAITRDQFEAFVKATGHLYGDGCHVEVGDKWVLRQELTFRAPGFAQDGRHPAVCINWEDANAYLKWLSAKTGKAYRLLTEAEREYVTRAGTVEAYWWGSNIRPDMASYDKRPPRPPVQSADNAVSKKSANPGARPFVKAAEIAPSYETPTGGTVPVHLYQPNPWGLYQLHGNVAEWVEDCWNRSYMGAPSDSSAVRSGDCERRVLRGGAWSYSPSDIRAAYRESARKDYRYVHVGFRIARDLVP